MLIKNKYIFLVFLFLGFLIFTPLVFAASNDFFQRAQEYYKKKCSDDPERTSAERSMYCYLFDKVSELSQEINNLGSRLNSLETTNIAQSAKITELEQRIAALESPNPPTSCIEPPSNLIGWWPGDGNAEDIVGNNEGSIQGGTSFASGKIGQAFIFEGLNDFVQTTTNNFPTGNKDRTIEMWVKINEFLSDIPEPSSPLETFFVGYGNFGSSGQIYSLGTAGNIYYFSQWGSAVFGPSLVKDRWYHVAVTNSGNAISLFLDGQVVKNGILGINTPSNTQFYIGRAPGSFGEIRRLNGLIDEVAIYDRALSSNEISAIFDAGEKGKCKLIPNPTKITISSGVSFDIPAGFKSMNIKLKKVSNLPTWAPTASFDNNTFHEQHRFFGNFTDVTIPILTSKYRLNKGGPDDFQADIIFNPEPNSQVLLLGQLVNYTFTSNSFNTDGFSTILITVGGGSNPQNLQTISLQRLENNFFVEKERLSCDGGAQCPYQSLPVLGGIYRVVLEGNGTEAVIGAILRH